MRSAKYVPRDIEEKLARYRELMKSVETQIRSSSRPAVTRRTINQASPVLQRTKSVGRVLPSKREERPVKKSPDLAVSGVSFLSNRARVRTSTSSQSSLSAKASGQAKVMKPKSAPRISTPPSSRASVPELSPLVLDEVKTVATRELEIEQFTSFAQPIVTEEESIKSEIRALILSD